MKTKYPLAALLSAAMLAFGLGGCGQSPTGNMPAKQIVLIAKDQAFRLADQPGLRNPPIALRRGETVELELRNEDPARVLHCFVISGLNVKTTRDLESGESVKLTITPEEKGTFTYACLMHPLMAGKVVVQ